MKFDSPAPTAPQWLAFLGSFMVPKGYMEKVGVDAFRDKPVGTGPYKLVEYQLNSRIVLERNDNYWGAEAEAPARHFRHHQGPLGARRRDPVRPGRPHHQRAGARGRAAASATPNLAAEINPITRVILLQVRNDLGFADPNVRLAAHHAIDKEALSKAFYGGAAVPLSVVATPGTPAAISPTSSSSTARTRPSRALAKSGFSPDKPAKIKFAATNGHFPSDYDIARAIQQMWKKVGIEAELETIEYAKYFELNRGAKLPEATLYSWDNATGDPEIFAGYLLNPKMPFSAWKGMDVGEKVLELFDDRRLQQAHRRLSRRSTRARSRPAPPSRCCRACITVVRKKNLNYAQIRQRLGPGQYDGLVVTCCHRPRKRAIQ